MRLMKTFGPTTALGLVVLFVGSVAQTASSPGMPIQQRLGAVSDTAVAPGLDAPVAGRRLDRGVALPDGVVAALAHRDGTMAVMIELAEAPALVAYAKARQQPQPGVAAEDTEAAATTAAQSSLAAIQHSQQSVVSALAGISGAKVMYRVQRVYNGVAANVNVRDIASIRRLPGVKAVHVLVPKEMSNWNSVPFIGAPVAWTKGLGYTGEGIKVGVIDTGIDYLHSNFGGPGASANYGANDTTVAGDAPNYPGVKVAGGHDFAGDAYTGSNTPVEDDDPMDCNGHGSHVAGTIGGYGVNADGTTFTGPYGPGTDFASLRIGPGVAPKAQLYALRVFGCSGSTNLVTEALDWAVDPNGDGDFSDHLDVVNMSLGSNFGSAADPDAVASENASLAGTIVVAASGNAGDTYYITSSPAAAGRALSVAASADKAAIVSGLLVNSPPSVQGTLPASEAQFGRDLAAGDVTGDLGVATPSNGCTAISGVSGMIALVDRGACTFQSKVDNAQAAGALGVLITNNVPGFPITMAGDSTVPNPTISVMMTDQTNGNAIRAAMGSGTVNVTLTASLRNSVKSIQPAVEDTIASFSSRGASRLGTALKPDVDSIGDTVFSTAALTGTQGVSFNGTSMATPHITGTMALLRQIHPTWTVEELKALVMNTAGHNLFLNVGPALPNTGPGRVGAGREDVAAAVGGNVVAYNADGSGRVSVSFGSVEVAAPLTMKKTIKVANKGKTAVTYSVAYNGTNMPDIPGVTFTTSTGTVTVGAGATATVDVILGADPAAMKHSRDISVASSQSNGFGAFSRHFVSEEAGYVTLTPSSGPALRVPIYAAARPVSAMGTTTSGIDISTGGTTGTRTLTLSGTGVNTGSSFSISSPFPGQDERSLVGVYELQEKSPELVPGAGIDDSADLQYVGVATTSDSFGPIVNFGISTYGNWSTANAYDTEFDVYLDVDRDGIDDFVIFNWDLGSATGFGAQDDYYSVVVDLATGNSIAERRINGISPGTRDTVTFNNRVMALSAYASDLGITGSFDYHIFTFTRELGFVDASDIHTYNIAAPGLSAPGSATYAPLGAPVYDDLPGGTITVNFDRTAYNVAGSQGLLLLHHHNVSGTQAQVLSVASIPQPKGDFNGDGMTDLLWRDQGNTGNIAVWTMNGATMTGATLTTPAAFPQLSWQIVGEGDFNGDGKPDILWRDQGATGNIAVWFMNGTVQTGVTLTTPAALPQLGWEIVGVGDFNGDGKPDILWRDQASPTSSGTIAVWFMNGTTMTSATVTTPSSLPLLNWKIVGVGDFNGDGKPDILWRDQTAGTLAVWFMNGTTMTSSALLNPSSLPLLNWQIQAVGDFNGDGKPDLVWRDTTGGNIAIWYMDGINMTSSTLTTPASFPVLSWKIVGPK